MRAYGVFFFLIFFFLSFFLFPNKSYLLSFSLPVIHPTLDSQGLARIKKNTRKFFHMYYVLVRRILRKIHVRTLIVRASTNHTLCHNFTFFQSSNLTQGKKRPLVHLYHRLLSCHTPPIRNQPSPYPILPYTLHYSVNIQLTSPHPHIPTILTYHFAPLPSLQQIEISIPRPLLHLLHLPLIPLPYPPPPPPPPSSPPPPPPSKSSS